MSATLAAVGVKLPSSVVTDGVFSNKPKSTPLMKSISGIFRQSVTALALTGLGCLAILILLGAAARRSRAVDRRRTLPPAMARLNTVKAKAAAGPGAAVRPAIPGARRPGQTSRPFATRLAALRRGSAVPDAVAPVSPPEVVRATAPVAVARPGILPASRPSTGTRAKAAAKSLLARLPKAPKAPAAPEPRSPAPVTVGAGAVAAGSETSRASARASVPPPASARATQPSSPVTTSSPSAPVSTPPSLMTPATIGTTYASLSTAGASTPPEPATDASGTTKVGDQPPVPAQAAPVEPPTVPTKPPAVPTEPPTATAAAAAPSTAGAGIHHH